MSKKTYMLAVQVDVVIPATVYVEVYANSEREALRGISKRSLKASLTEYREAFLEEAKSDLSEAKLRKPRKLSCGRASQYHSAAECEMCAEVETE